MAFREKRDIDQTTSIPLSRLATPSEISSYIKRLITTSQYDFHETEALEVQGVVLNQAGNRGSISGTFLNSGNFLENVKPLFGNMTTIPVIGEHVVVTEYNGQNYYSAIINRKGSPNETMMSDFDYLVKLYKTDDNEAGFDTASVGDDILDFTERNPFGEVDF